MDGFSTLLCLWGKLEGITPLVDKIKSPSDCYSLREKFYLHKHISCSYIADSVFKYPFPAQSNKFYIVKQSNVLT